MQVTVVIHLKYTLPQLDPRPAANVVTFLNDWPPRFSRIFLVLPEITKPLGRKFAISNCMLDVFVTEIMLQRPSIHALIGELEPSGMPQHVGMDSERHFGGGSKACPHPGKGNGGT